MDQSIQIGMLHRLSLVLRLVQRDYTLQFAGTTGGIIWLAAQYLFQIAVYYAIFGFVLSGGESGRFSSGSDYFSFLLSGMIFWLPLSEMFLRSCVILHENRALIRRTKTGMQLFVWIPIFRGIIHYMVLFPVVALILYSRDTLSPLFPIAFIYSVSVMLLLAGWGFIFARMSVILLDVSSAVRLLLQIVFWLTPIVYDIPGSFHKIMGWNPLFGIIEAHRFLLIRDYRLIPTETIYGIIALFILSVIAYFASSRRLNTVVVDNL